MKLEEFKNALSTIEELTFVLPNGAFVPNHFHITELGQVTKNFIDCGGTIRNESTLSLQLWVASDTDHRLSAQKLKDIIQISEAKLGIRNDEIEVEYQDNTIGTYLLAFEHGRFYLKNKFTDCLAKDNCGVPEEKTQMKLADLQAQDSCCEPNSGCC